MIIASSCQTDALKVEIELRNQLIGITSAHNARQLGGYQIGKKRIKNDLLLRTAAISSLSEADSALLADKYKVQRIYDFRGHEESVSSPDVIPGNAGYLSLSIPFAGSESSSVQNKSQEETIKMLLMYADNPLVQDMCENMYDKIFFEESSQDVYRRFFADLVTLNPEDGAVLWHCTQGKDRAGSASAMLLAALGADRDLIMADFTLSKDYYDPFLENITVENEIQSNVLNTLISANPVIFQKTLDKVDEKYGSLRNYLTECIGVTSEMMETLRERYLE
ncbi:MAG: tyrosine-protein phosphatase [Bacteroidales bacterium]|nr:tyrosine-protein phosphatase [Bacteroidales bacterium]